MDNQPDASFIQFVFVCIAGNNLPDYFPTCHLPSSTIGIEDAYSRAYAFPANAVNVSFICEMPFNCITSTTNYMKTAPKTRRVDKERATAN